MQRLLDEFGGDPNAVDHFGWPLFHIAVGFDHIELAKLFIAKGANPHALMHDGTNARELVNGVHNEEMFALLDSLNVK